MTLEERVKKFPFVSYGKSIMGYIVDCAFVLVFTLICFFSFASPIYVAMGGQQAFTQGSSFLIDSGLVYEGDSGFMTYATVEADSKDDSGEHTYGYKTLEDKVWNYYTGFIASDDRTSFDDVEEKTFANMAAWTLKNVYGLSEEKNDNSFYVPQVIGGVYNYASKPVLKDEIKAKVALSDATTLEDLLAFYSASDGTGAYIDAYSHLMSQPYFTDVQNKLDEIQYVAYAPFGGFAVLVFFLLIPLLNKDGKTLGKMIIGTAVIDKRRKHPKKWQILVHYGVIVCWWAFLLLVHSYIWAIFAIFLSIMDYLVRIINKNGQSLHDIMAQTVVIDARHTDWEHTDYQGGEEVLSAAEERKNKKQTWEEKYANKASYEKKEEADEDYGLLNMETVEKKRKAKDSISSFDEFEKETGNKNGEKEKKEGK